MFDYKAVLFDLDGTLVDSMGIWKDIDVEYLGRFHIPMPDGLQEAIEGISMYETATYFKNHFHIKDSHEKMIADWNDMAYRKYTQVPAKNGILRFLEYLEKKQIPCGLATSNSRTLTQVTLDSHRMSRFFKVVITGYEVIKGKPEPDVYLTAARRLQVPPEKCLVFEDLIAGIMAGKRAGMYVCAVEDDYSAKDREAKIRMADMYIKDYEDEVLYD